jgi:hypothetical protein
LKADLKAGCRAAGEMGMLKADAEAAYWAGIGWRGWKSVLKASSVSRSGRILNIGGFSGLWKFGGLGW